MKVGNRRFYVIHVEKIDNDKLESYGKEFIIQLWLQIYNDVKNNLQCFRLTNLEREELNKSNLFFTEFLPCEEELLQSFDFSNTEKYIWTNKQLIEKFDFKVTPQILGKTINKIKDNYPDLIEIKRRNTGNIYYLPLKK